MMYNQTIPTMPTKSQFFSLTLEQKIEDILARDQSNFISIMVLLSGLNEEESHKILNETYHSFF